MANIRVDLEYTIHDGSEIKFRSPADCSAITGLIVYYPGADGDTTSTVFALADAHGNNVGDIDHLFAEDVVVKVILDVTTSMAFVQNADTNAYLEQALAGKVPTSRKVNGKVLSSDITLYASDVGLGNVANEKQYSANNPPPYPVTSVNGKTGAVTLNYDNVGAAASGHVHDTRYYTKTQTDALLIAKSSVGHTHAITEITGINDYVVNSGSTQTSSYNGAYSITWTWRIWKSGRKECEGWYSATVDINAAWGNWYESAQLPNIAYPISFTTEPVLEVSILSNSGLILQTVGGFHKNQTCGVCAMRPTAVTGQQIFINFVARGS